MSVRHFFPLMFLSFLFACAEADDPRQIEKIAAPQEDHIVDDADIPADDTIVDQSEDSSDSSYDLGLVDTTLAGTFNLVANHSGKCVDINLASPENAAKIQQWDCTTTNSQKWRLKLIGTTYQIRAVSSGKCLTVSASSLSNGAAVVQMPCAGTTNQLFTLDKNASGNYQIIAKHSGKALEILNSSTVNGAIVQQWTKGSGKNQFFALRAAPLPQFVHTEGTKIVNLAGDDIYLSGINLGNWLVWEGYLMMGDFKFRTHTQFFNSLSAAFGGSDRAAEFEYQWRLNYVEDNAIAKLKSLGFNSVRVPFNHKLFWWDGNLRDNGFQFFDQLITSCRKHSMYVILDMHGAPGYQNPGDHADNGNSNASQPRDSVKFWDSNNVSIASQIWRHIATRYKDEPVILGYDLINEPVPQDGREYELLPSFIAMRNAIREVDKNHIIIAEGSWWGSDLSKIDWGNATVQSKTGIKSQWDQNLLYEIHHYGPVAGTMGRENITNRLNIPLILGEYGETDEANLKETKNWARQRLAGDFPWSFKKMSHDKTLWTIPPNAEYNKVKAFINLGGTPPTQSYNAMIDFAKINTRNGHSSHVWHQSFFDAIAPR